MGIIVFSLLITILLVAVGLFLLFRKFGNNNNPLSSFYYWITTIILTPTIYVGFIFIWFSISASFEKQEFNKENWVEHRDTRFMLVEDLIESNELIGLTREEVKNKLGKPDYEDDSLTMFYIGYSTEHFLNMDPDWLEIIWVDKKVSSLNIRE